MKEKREDNSGARRPVTIIGPDASVAGGRLEVEYDLRLDGSIEADVAVGGRLVVSGNASITGSVRATNLIVEGRVSGDVHVDEFIHVRAGAQLEGRIRTSRLVVDDGACGFVDVQTLTDDAEERKALVESRRVLAQNALRSAEAARRAASRSRFMAPPREPVQDTPDAAALDSRGSHPVYEDASATLVWSEDVVEGTAESTQAASATGPPGVQLKSSAAGTVAPRIRKPVVSEEEITLDRTDEKSGANTEPRRTDELLESSEMSRVIDALDESPAGEAQPEEQKAPRRGPEEPIATEESRDEGIDRFW